MYLASPGAVILEEEHHILILVEGGEGTGRVGVGVVQLQEDGPGVYVLRYLRHRPVPVLELNQTRPQSLKNENINFLGEEKIIFFN